MRCIGCGLKTCARVHVLVHVCVAIDSYAMCLHCFTVAHMQESELERTPFPGRSDNTGGEAECYTSVFRSTARGK